MTRLSLAYTNHDLPIEPVREVAGENALDAYPRLDGKALSQVAQRIGVPVKELATAPDLSKHPHVVKIATLAFRTVGPWS
jgi:hypothetical protein